MAEAPVPPVVLAEPEPMPAPMMDHKTHMPTEPMMAPAPTAMPDKRTIVYLASYKTEAAAHKGWKILAKASPILAQQKPVTHSVDLGAKGKFIRLYGMATDEAERTAICKQVGKRVDECGARNRE